MKTLYIKPLSENAKKIYSDKMPDLKGYEGDAGFDMIIDDFEVKKPEALGGKEVVALKFGVAAEFSDGTGYYLVPRSSVYKTPFRMANSIGIIDKGYRGQLIANCDTVVENWAELFEPKGKSFFQIIRPDLEPFVVELVEELSDTERGARGFGSTGNKHA